MNLNRRVLNGSNNDNNQTIEDYFVHLDLGGFGSPGDWYDILFFTAVLVHEEI
jgi:hypothetical protein